MNPIKTFEHFCESLNKIPFITKLEIVDGLGKNRSSAAAAGCYNQTMRPNVCHGDEDMAQFQSDQLYVNRNRDKAHDFSHYKSSVVVR
jgi:hypothetical protein